MAREVKLIQKGINVQANSMAVPPGTVTDVRNLSLEQDGTFSRIRGFDNAWLGLGNFTAEQTRQRPQAIFSGNGCIQEQTPMLAYGAVSQSLAYPSASQLGIQPQWTSARRSMSTRMRWFGNVSQESVTTPSLTTSAGIGKLWLTKTTPAPAFTTRQNENFFDKSTTFAFGSVGNLDADSSSTLFRTGPHDVVQIGNTVYASDAFAIFSAPATGPSGSVTVLAGSVTTGGTTDATGSSARFTNASYMTTDGTNLFVADSNSIRRVTPAGVVTTFAGSITVAGDTDGVGTAARFREVSGLCFYDGFIYATERSGHRVRRVDPTTASVTIFAGLLSPATSGFIDAVGTSARFNTPIGIEEVGGSLYVGDSVNNSIRKIVVSSASVTSFAGATPSTAGSGANMSAGIQGLSTLRIPSPTVRGVIFNYTPLAANGGYTGPFEKQLIVESTVNNAQSIDVGILGVLANYTLNTADFSNIGQANNVLAPLYRCPSSVPNTTAGVYKADTMGLFGFNGIVADAGDVSAVALDTWRLAVTDNNPVVDLTLQSEPLVLRTLSMEQSFVPTAALSTGGTFLGTATQCAYRVLNGYKTSTGRLVFGAPSERFVVNNTAGAPRAATITAFTAPFQFYDNGTAFIQVYRTRTVSNAIDPGDTMYLCQETSVNQPGSIVFLDNLEDTSLGAELYTNSSQSGAAGAFLPAPCDVKAMAGFQSRLCVSRHNTPAEQSYKVLGAFTRGTDTVTFTFGDYINPDPFQTGAGATARGTLFSVTLTAGTTTAFGTNTFATTTSGGAAQNIVDTTRELVRVINSGFLNYAIVAHYNESDPGSFTVRSLWPRASLTMSATNSTVITVKSTQASTDNQNVVIYSDQNTADSITAVNQTVVGAVNDPIRALCPLSDALMIPKSAGLWRTDLSATQLIDSSIECDDIYGTSFATIANTWIGLFRKGFAQFDSSVATLIGQPIRQFTTLLSNFGQRQTFGAASDSEGVYVAGFRTVAARNEYMAYYPDQRAWTRIQLFNSSGNFGVPRPGTLDGRIVFAQTNQPRAVLASRRAIGTASYPASTLFSFWDVTFNVLTTENSGTRVLCSYDPALNYGSLTQANAFVASLQGASQRSTKSATPEGIWAVAQSITITTPTITIDFDRAPVLSALNNLVLSMPVMSRLTYAPFTTPGSFSHWQSGLMTVERLLRGTVTIAIANRNAARNENDFYRGFNVYGATTVSVIMPRVGTAGVESGSDNAYVTNEPHRFEVPSSVSVDQNIVAQLETAGCGPFVLKSFALDYANTDSPKVRQ